MHYGDKEQIENNVLVLVVYKHSTSRKNSFEYELSAIHDCKMFPVRLLNKILSEPKKCLGKYFKDKEAECWYKATIKSTDGFFEFEVPSIEDVSESNSEFDRLH